MQRDLRLSVPKQGLDAIAFLGGLSDEAFAAVIDTLADLKLGADFEGIVALAAKASSARPSELRNALGRFIFPVAELAVRHSATGEAVVDAIGDSLAADSPEDWLRDNQIRWERVRQRLVSVFEIDSSVRLYVKAAELWHSRVAVLSRVRLLSELRPLFNEAGEVVKATLLTETLVIEYDDPSGEDQSLFLAINDEDLAELRAQLDRAESKRRELRSVAEAIKVPLLEIH